MEERALYRAILAGPHDDAARLVYADWLDENADRFPPPAAKAERARAELVRLQCELARRVPDGWTGTTPSDPDLAKRHKRLLFQHGKKWRRVFPLGTATAPFDRGFPRPFRALRPHEFLGYLPATFAPANEWLLTLPPDSPLRRYALDEPFATCPLWDVHLFGSAWQGDRLADHGQYAPLLADVGRSPALARVGWLKVSFFQTRVYDFLRTGNFANVETLVLNCGPFPEVLEAVAENESFRSLRYVRFGADWWAWAGFPLLIQYISIEVKLRAANARHVPFGEMRAVLRGILRETPVVPPPPPVRPLHVPLRFPAWAPAPAPDGFEGARKVMVALWLACVLIGGLAGYNNNRDRNTTPKPDPKYQFDTNKYQIPNYELYNIDPDLLKLSKPDPAMEAMLRRLREGKSTYPLPGGELPPEVERWLRESQSKPPVAPPPRPVERKGDPPDEK